MELPKIGSPLSEDHLHFIKTFAKSCRHSAVQMVVNAQSGHPGGSLSTIDYLSALYAFIISQTGEKVVVSNGHISPAVYSVLAELNYIPKKEVVVDFRKFGTRYEGHITRHVDGIEYGTGPLGIGVSIASAFALAEKMQKSGKKVYGLVGDGECQEGQVHEMIHFSKQYKLDNYILFVDYNKVQLTASLKEIQDINIKKIFEAGDWHVIEINGHDYSEIWNALSEAQNIINKPIVIIGNTIMGKGVDFMEVTGENNQSDWHGKAPKPEDAEAALKILSPDENEQSQLEEFRKHLKWKPEKPNFPKPLSKIEIDTGKPHTYATDEVIDCRSAYGKALLDLAKHNPKIIALTADLKGSVMTKYVSAELPDQYIECGIAEQHMVSAAGGFSLTNYVPFASTFGAFMTSRAKDQARVNDINNCNVKMVATHCGLSVGEDGPTHQAIDDMGSFLGFYNTMILEPADPNHCDHLTRFIASHFGNFYMRMGRHKFPIITKENGTPFYDQNYIYKYGKCDLIREGKDLTIAATGAMVANSLEAIGILKESKPEISIELIAISSIKEFDQTLFDSIKKTKKLITIEDHNTLSGLGSQIARELLMQKITPDIFEMLGPKEYQLSGKAPELYNHVGTSPEKIAKKISML